MKGQQIRIKLRDGLWWYTEVMTISPTFNVFQLKSLGIKDEDDEVREPERLTDSADKESPTEPIPGTKKRPPKKEKTFMEQMAENAEKLGIPPGPASETPVEKVPDDQQNELF